MLTFAASIVALLGASAAHAQAITRFVRDTGNINFVSTGGSLRNSDTNTCDVNATSTTALSGIPAGTTIRNAYLYWGGSGGTADTSVTFNGSPVTATRTFAATYTGRHAQPSVLRRLRQRHLDRQHHAQRQLHVRRPDRGHRLAALRRQRGS